MGDISGTTGLTAMVHLSKFAEFYKEISANAAKVVTLCEKMKNVHKYLKIIYIFSFSLPFKKLNFPAPNRSGFAKS